MSFQNLGLIKELLKSVAEKEYATPTPIQEQAIPLILSGSDLLAGAQTGTGKTAGFTLPLLHKLMTSEKPPSTKPQSPRVVRGLILAPTRELAAQVADSVRNYGKYLPLKSTVIFGGANIQPQIRALKAGVDILIATPGRLLDHVNQKTVDLSRVEIFILDEADRMLDMGFIHDVRRILSLLPKTQQNLLFSATFSPQIKTLASSFLKSPKTIEVAKHNTTAENITQSIYHVEGGNKRSFLCSLITSHNWQQVLVFTRTKHGANKLCTHLLAEGISSAAIHGNKSQGARMKALQDFKRGSIKVLVATDIAARGIDINQLPHVINFELPNVPEDYVHRIGRTGRAGNTGEAISLVSREEQGFLRDIERLLKRKIPVKIRVPIQSAA